MRNYNKKTLTEILKSVLTPFSAYDELFITFYAKTISILKFNLIAITILEISGQFPTNWFTKIKIYLQIMENILTSLFSLEIKLNKKIIRSTLI